MTTNDEFVQRWMEIVDGSDTTPLRGTRMMIQGDIIYSYGPHFELARPLRDRRGKVRAFLLNGDRWSSRDGTTNRHQSLVRSAVSNKGVPVIILPASALNAAGIDPETVQLVDVRADRFETIQHKTTEFPPGARYRLEEITEYLEKGPEDLEKAVERRHQMLLGGWENRKNWHKKMPGLWNDPGEAPERPTVDQLESWERMHWVVTGHVEKLYASWQKYSPEITVTYEDGHPVYEWETHRHWLGDSLIRARVTWRRRNTCRWCDGSGFGMGPGLKYDWEHPSCPECRGRGFTISEHHRWAYYLSSFDYQESRPLYFFCELPYRSHPETVAEAYEVLKPDPVRLAEQMGRDVTRQGDIFAVPVRLTRKQLKAKGARIERRTQARIELSPWMHEVQPANRPYILNTNHTATEVAFMPDGLTLARGTLYHDPQGRDADHARRRLGDGATWHIVMKNTVPVTRG